MKGLVSTIAIRRQYNLNESTEVSKKANLAL